MDIERIRRIEDNIEAVGGVENYINEVYNNSSDISDLSFYINNSIKDRLKFNCNICEISDINRITNNLYPILTLNDSIKIMDSKLNNTILDKTTLESYISYEDIKKEITKIPDRCIQCFNENISNQKLNDTRTCYNTYGLKDVPDNISNFSCPNGYTNKSNLETINCPDQNECNKTLCCDVKEDYMKYLIPAAIVFCIIIVYLQFLCKKSCVKKNQP